MFSTFTAALFSVSLQTRDRIGSGGPVVDCRGLLENDGSVCPRYNITRLLSMLYLLHYSYWSMQIIQ